jgi:metallophosphoesterase (TIGR03768 family)
MVDRRTFLKYSVLAVPGFQLAGCGGGDGGASAQFMAWPIDGSTVYTTAERQIVAAALPAGTPQIRPAEVSKYAQYGYSAWQVGGGLAYADRFELAPQYAGAASRGRLLSFFAMTDIHLSDKESPAQPIYGDWSAAYGATPTGGAGWSPCVVSTTHVLDAAVQTINALHARTPFDFGISLGDNINNSQYNELRWFIDVLDGKIITPSSGAHAGADTIDYQKPYQAAGLDKRIPWYQAIGNHDQFWMGSYYENAITQPAHVGSVILNIDSSNLGKEFEQTGFYQGVVDGSTPYGDVVGAGPQAAFPTPPTVVADANRRSLATNSSSCLNWMSEFFSTTSTPLGHGFTQANLDQNFACYSFEPKAGIPLKVIVLDDTANGMGQNQPSTEYARAALDQRRLDWLTSELDEGQRNNKLMIIAAHIPIYPQKTLGAATGNYPLFTSTSPLSVVNDSQLLTLLHGYSNLILWIAGHRHVNVVTPQPAPAGMAAESAFWEVETSSLRDFPQQFRTFEILANSDNTLSIMVTNVDPAVGSGSPAASSRRYAIGSARIFSTPPTIPAGDTSSHAYNAKLVAQLSPAMQTVIGKLALG